MPRMIQVQVVVVVDVAMVVATVLGDTCMFHPQNPPVYEKPKKLKCDIKVTPSSINSGGSATITWSSKNGDSVSINQGIGSVQDSGTRVVTGITQTTTFTLTVKSNNNGSFGGNNFGNDKVECSDTVKVEVPPQNLVCSISANPTYIQNGGSTAVSWSSNGNSATLNSNSVSANGSQVFSPNNTKTYTLRVFGNNGATKDCSVTVTVQDNNPNLVCSISANPTYIQNGGATTVSWSSNGNSATLNGNSVATNGSNVYTPNDTKTYTLRVFGTNGATKDCSVTVTVGNNYNQTPWCTITASSTQVNAGNSVTLTWNSNNASSASISNIGSVSLNGSQSFAVNQYTIFAMTVYGNNGQTYNCQTAVSVNTDSNNGGGYCNQYVYNGGTNNNCSTSYVYYSQPQPIYYPQTQQYVQYQQPIYVPLAQVPYTGAEDAAVPFFTLATILTSVFGVRRMFV
jgi:hypothetical protein